MWKGILLVDLILCVCVQEVSTCQPTIPDVEKSVEVLEKVSKALSEVPVDAEGNPKPITTAITFFKGLSKFASVVGGVLGLAGFIYDQFQESEFDKIKKEFQKVNQGIRDLEFQFNDLRDIIEKEAAWTRMHPNIQFLNTVSIVLDKSLNAEHKDTRTSSKEKLLFYYKQSKIFDSLHGIYFDVIGSDFYKSTVEILYKQTKGNWASINTMNLYLSGILFRGHLALNSACVLQLYDEGFQTEDARQKCLVISNDNFLKKDQLFEQKFDSFLSKCRTVEYLQYDIEKIVRDAIDRETTLNSIVGDRIVVLIRKKYFWLDASVIVYDDISGYDKHCMTCSLLKYRHYGRNWCVMLRYKPAYRNPFTAENELLSANINYNPSYDTANYAKLYPENVDETASQVFESILGKLKNLPFRHFAVIRSRLNSMFETENYHVHITTTDYEQHLHKEYYTGLYWQYIDGTPFQHNISTQHFNRTISSQHFSVIFSLPWGQVSLLPRCPAYYPYVYNFGKFCTNHPETWFNKTNGYNSHVSCALGWSLCRSRTKAHTNQNKKTGLTGEEDFLLGEMIPNYEMKRCLEMMMMMISLTIMMTLLVFFCFIK